MSMLRLSAVLCVLAVSASARIAKRPAPAKKTLHRLSGTRARRISHLGRRSTRGHLRFTHGRRTLYPRRAAAAEISPQRAQQIQEALVEAGELHEAPTGRWDTATRQAMKQYQSSNGFEATGFPDAKSLMKLGLGPHPLPIDVDPMAQAKSGATSFPSNSQQARAAATRTQ